LAGFGGFLSRRGSQVLVVSRGPDEAKWHPLHALGALRQPKPAPSARRSSRRFFDWLGPLAFGGRERRFCGHFLRSQNISISIDNCLWIGIPCRFCQQFCVSKFVNFMRLFEIHPPFGLSLLRQPKAAKRNIALHFPF
jgi:hypothetical protein